MLPAAPTFNVANSLFRHAIVECNDLLPSAVRANSKYVGLFQFCIRRLAMGVALLLLHVSYVFKLGALYEVGWITALRNIASVKNALIWLQRAIDELKHQSVSAFNFPVDVNFSISKLVGGGGPQPTSLSFENVPQQPGLQRSGGSGGSVAVGGAELAICRHFRFE